MNPILWQPNPSYIQNSQMMRFINFVNKRYSLNLDSYEELYNWSINYFKLFWEIFYEYSGIIYSKKFNNIISDHESFFDVEWFVGTRLNYAENLLKCRDNRIAIQFFGENKVEKNITFNELYQQVSCISEFFKTIGVVSGDRIVGYMPNLPENVVCMLAGVSRGAIWSSCSPDFGVKGVLDRFGQIQPKIMIVADGYYYKGKKINYSDKIDEVSKSLSSLEYIIRVSYINSSNRINFKRVIEFDDMIHSNFSNIEFIQLPFSHPLYIMYSSGTTGKPKSIVHSAGGTLIQHLKELKLHVDLRRDESIFYFTTCGWMMWNWLISALAVESTIILYDGSPFYPNYKILLKLAQNFSINVFGTSAKYLNELQKNQVLPESIGHFSKLRTILSTGSPLMENQFDFVYNSWKSDVQLSSISGGTDIISCFALGNPILPVRRGELQCRGLGMAVESYDSFGNSIIGTTGELVCTKPFPSMPIYFWNDIKSHNYRQAYFNKFQNVWTHGDFIEINLSGGLKIHGRSDATLNPGGVRIGTSEIYKVVESMPEIIDSLIIGQKLNGDERIVLFIILNNNIQYSKKLINKIKTEIHFSCSPRHVPEKIIPINEIPYTVNGKKVEIAVRNIINGMDVTNKDALVNPSSLEQFKNIKELNL